MDKKFTINWEDKHKQIESILKFFIQFYNNYLFKK